MKQFPTLRILICLTVFVFAGRLAEAQQIPGFTAGEAAVITMKSGEKFEAKILRDAPDSVEIEYKLTPKIKDKKILLKNDIASVKKQSPAETDFAERGLAKLLPTPDLKDASYYESTIQDKLRTFVGKYPGTPESAEVEKIIATLVEEKSKVLSGQVKMEGRWLDAATVKRDAYNIDAYRQYLEMREKAAENKDTRYLEALRVFEKLRIEHGVSPYFVKAIPDAQEYLKKFEVQLVDLIKEAPILLKRRTDGLKQLPPNEAPAARKAIDEEERAYKEALERQFKDKVRWHEISKFDAKGLQDIATAIVKERAELAAIDISALQADSDVLMTAIRYIADQNLAEAAVALDKAVKIPNPSYRPLIQSLSKELVALREKAKKEQKAAAASANAGGSATTEGDKAGVNPVAEAMKKLQDEKQKKAAEAAKSAAAKAQAAADQNSETTTVAADSQTSLMEKLNDYLPLIGGGLLVVIALLWFMGKRKKAKDEDA